MIGRLLIDECLSPELVQLAIEAGHVESSSVRDRGRLGLKDWELMEYVICLDSALEMDIDLQQELFRHALNALAELPDLINQALEVYEHDSGLISVNMYDIPPSRS
jgi:hypothetical protein